MVTEVLKQIERRERFVLTSHARPDGDAVGSVLACSQILREMGKQAEVVLSDGVPRIYQQLPFTETVIDSTRSFSSASITTSAGALSRTSIGSIPQPAPLENWFTVSLAKLVSASLRMLPPVCTPRFLRIPARSCSRAPTNARLRW